MTGRKDGHFNKKNSINKDLLNMDREQYLQYCKDRAYKQFYYDMSGHEHSQPEKAYINACASMISDLSKNKDTKEQSKVCAFLLMFVNDKISLRRFIEGFN
jgi:prenyltransferase beta subunit